MADKDARYWRTLYEVSASLNSTLTLSEILKETVKLTAKAMNVNACSLRLLDDKEEKLELVAAYGLSDAYLNKGPVELEKSLIDREVMQSRAVTIPDVTKDSRWQYPEESGREGIHSVLSVPLSVKGKVIGAVRIYTSKPRKFYDRDIQFLTALANQAAIAIQNAKLYRMCLQSYQEAVEEVMKKTDIWGSGEEK